MTDQPTPSSPKKTRYSLGVYLVGFVFLLIALFERVTGYVPPSRRSFSHLRRVSAGEVKTDFIIAAALIALGVVVGLIESKIDQTNRPADDVGP